MERVDGLIIYGEVLQHGFRRLVVVDEIADAVNLHAFGPKPIEAPEQANSAERKED